MDNLRTDERDTVPLFRHRKKGKVYRIIARARLASEIYPLQEGLDLVVYASVDNHLHYVRLASEFYDGRFEAITC